MLMYSFFFSPNDPLKIIETQILILDKSLSETVGRTLIASDFNSNMP